MYYKRVNRGLSFTKPGIYSFGLLLLVGMIGVTTGINGLYVFLSAGIGGFIISGMLSEKAMKETRVAAVRAAAADAGTEFAVEVAVENQSSWFSVFELDTLLALDAPRFKLISAGIEAPVKAHASCLRPQRVTALETVCRGLPRGLHAKMTAVQKTTFPFGLLEKFKVVEVEARFVIGPALDLGFLAILRPKIRAALAALDADREFFAHRSYQSRDPRRDLDWKKSAMKAPRDWVVKQYRARGEEARVRVLAPWGVVAGAADPVTYERRLAKLRTTLKALEESQRAYVLDWGDRLVEGAELCYESLAGAPDFAARARGPHVPTARGRDAEAFAMTLAFDGEDVA